MFTCDHRFKIHLHRCFGYPCMCLYHTCTTLQQIRNCAMYTFDLVVIFFTPFHRERTSHWSERIAGDSSSERWPSDESPLSHPGRPSNRMANSGRAVSFSLGANKFTIQTRNKVLKRNGQKLIRVLWDLTSWKDKKCYSSKKINFLLLFYFQLLSWFIFSIVGAEC